MKALVPEQQDDVAMIGEGSRIVVVYCPKCSEPLASVYQYLPIAVDENGRVWETPELHRAVLFQQRSSTHDEALEMLAYYRAVDGEGVSRRSVSLEETPWAVLGVPSSPALPRTVPVWCTHHGDAEVDLGQIDTESQHALRREKPKALRARLRR